MSQFVTTIITVVVFMCRTFLLVSPLGFMILDLAVKSTVASGAKRLLKSTDKAKTVQFFLTVHFFRKNVSSALWSSACSIPNDIKTQKYYINFFKFYVFFSELYASTCFILN